MQTYLFPLLLAASMLLSVNVFAQRPDVIELPAPQMTGGMPLFDTIAARQSTKAYSDKEVSLQNLSTILWAAYGFNRPDMRVIPTPNNRQHLSVYVFLKDSVYLYDAATNKLHKKADGDHRRSVGGQEYVYIAPVNLLFVADGANGAGTGSHISVGCASQNVYLASAAMGLATVIRGSGINAEKLRPLLKLAETDEFIAAQTVGYKPE